jgi:hypothetical protein
MTSKLLEGKVLLFKEMMELNANPILFFFFAALGKYVLTLWLMEPGNVMPHLQGLSNNPYPEPNKPNSS